MVTSMPPQPPCPSSSPHTYTFSHKPPIKLRPSAHFTDSRASRRDDVTMRGWRKGEGGGCWRGKSNIELKLVVRPAWSKTPAANDCCRHEVHSLGTEDGTSCHQLCLVLFIFNHLCWAFRFGPCDGWKADRWRYSRICQVWSVFFFPHSNIRTSIVDGQTLKRWLFPPDMMTHWLPAVKPLLFFYFPFWHQGHQILLSHGYSVSGLRV